MRFEICCRVGFLQWAHKASYKSVMVPCGATIAYTAVQDTNAFFGELYSAGIAVRAGSGPGCCQSI